MLYRQTLAYLPAQALGPILLLVSMVVWTYVLSPTEMGVMALITAAQELIYAGTLSWLSFYTVRFHQPETTAVDHTKFLEGESAALLAASLAAACSVLGLVFILDAPWTAELTGATLAYTLSRGVAAQLADRARAEHDPLTYSILQILWPLLALAFGLTLALSWQPTAAAVLWGSAIAQVLAIAPAVLRLGIGWRPSAASRAFFKEALTYGVPLVAGTILVWAASNGIRFIIQAMEGAAAVGLMTVGWGLGQRAATFAAMLVTTAAFPVAMHRARTEGFESGQAQLVSNGVLLLAALAPVVAGLWLITVPFVELAISQPFRDVTIAVLPLSLIGGALRCFRLHFGEQIFLLHARPSVPLANDAVDAVLTLGAAAIGMAMNGLEGAVQGAAIGAAISLAVTLVCGWWFYGFGFPISHVLRIGFATAVMSASVIVLGPQASLTSLAITILAGAITYAIAMAMAYPREAAQAACRLRAAANTLNPRKETKPT